MIGYSPSNPGLSFPCAPLRRVYFKLGALATSPVGYEAILGASTDIVPPAAVYSPTAHAIGRQGTLLSGTVLSGMVQAIQFEGTLIQESG